MARYALDISRASRAAHVPEFRAQFEAAAGAPRRTGAEVDSTRGTDAMDAQNTHQNTHTKDTKATPGEEEERKAKSLPRFADAGRRCSSRLCPRQRRRIRARGESGGARGRPAQDPASGSLRAGGDGARGERARRGGRAARPQRDVLPQKARDGGWGSTEDQRVDVDLSEEGNATKVSRQQAFVKLRWNGEFCLRNVGRGRFGSTASRWRAGAGAAGEPRADRSRGDAAFVFQSGGGARGGPGAVLSAKVVFSRRGDRDRERARRDATVATGHAPGRERRVRVRAR